jgi:hypothetical protein
VRARSRGRAAPALLRHAGALLLGAAVALGAVAVHRSTGAGLPWGLLLALAATFAAAWWLRGSRWPRLAVSFAAGWLALFAVVVAARPEGDYALASDLPGYTLMGASVLLVVVAMTSLAARPPGSGGPTT